MNPLDSKPFKNKLAGKGAKTKQRFKPNSNLSGYGKGKDVVVGKNKLAMPVTRTGSSTGKLVKRTYTDVGPGLQGGLRETMSVLTKINEFCEGDGWRDGWPIPNIINYLKAEYQEGRISIEEVAEELHKHGWTNYVNVAHAKKCMTEGAHPLNDLFVRIRHAQKTGDKAKLQLAIDELESKARRYNLMKDPEVLEFL